MGALCRKKQYQRRLARILAVLAPSALFLVCLVSLAGQANAESSRTVRINEIMAKNLSGLQGQDGQPVDWVELYNASEQPVSLKGAGLSNKAGNAYAWEFPEYILAPGEYLVVYVDGLDPMAVCSSPPSKAAFLRRQRRAAPTRRLFGAAKHRLHSREKP